MEVRFGLDSLLFEESTVSHVYPGTLSFRMDVGPNPYLQLLAETSKTPSPNHRILVKRRRTMALRLKGDTRT